MSRKKDTFRKKKIMPGVSTRGRYLTKEPAKSDKIQRNAPCPCGSGKKYKACCRITPRSFWQRIKRWFSGKES